MAPRTGNPAMTVPDALPALLGLNNAIQQTGLPGGLRELVHLRVSQINGCSVCVNMHADSLRKLGEPEERLQSVAAWRDTPYFSESERAALALAEESARLNDRANPVPEEVWQDVAKHFTEPALGGLVLTIGLINLWNRVNILTGQEAGSQPG